jgi:gpW
MATTIWTVEDRDLVAAAVVKLATGKRAVTVSFNGGGEQRSVTYQMSQLSELRALLAEMNRGLGAGATYRLGATRNGLGGPTGTGGVQ